MSVVIVVELQAPEPVYEQIVRQVHAAVRDGRVPAGAPLPTVRQLADDLAVNRNTVARAYKLLEDQGVIVTAGRKGTFVRADATRQVARLQTDGGQLAMQRVIERLRHQGLGRDEITEIFKQALRAGTSKG